MDLDRQGRLSAVLDTNVLLGADRRRLLLLASLGAYQLIISQYILEEVQRIMLRLGWSQAAADILLQAIHREAEVVDERTITGGNYDLWLRDPKDHPIIATALAGKADYLVTQNLKDFPPKLRFAGVTMVTPEAFIRLLESRV
jgi:predicted nucleic acid-binding protein